MDKVYLAYDGDGCGRKVGKAIIANDEKALHEISAKIDLGHEIVNHWIAERHGKRISGGGDEGSFKVDKEVAEEVEQLRKDYYYATGITISVGIGSNLSEAGRALLAAKFRGKDQVAWYNDSVEKDIEKARKKVKKGKATQEEYKLADSYLEKSEKDMGKEEDCKYCEESDGVDLEHCKYCHDYESKGEEDCPYCKEDSKEESKDVDDIDGAEKAAEQGDLGEQEDRPGEMNPPEIGKPDPSSEQPIGQDSVMEEPSPNNGEALPATDQPGDGIDPEDNHSKEALAAIAEQIEAEGKPSSSDMAAVDETETAAGSDMEGNVSRPEGYEQNVPSDMGLEGENGSEDSEEEPDLAGVLQEGLDDSADSIQKEKVVQMAAQALEGFKSCRDILESSQQQAPQLYQSSIMMLKAMIEMAKLLGLGSSLAPDSGMIDDNEWEDPFPAHPDQGGERKPGHAAGSEAAAPAPQR